MVPKTGSRRSDGPISRFRFCGENVGRSFAVFSNDPFFRTNKESSIWRQNDHAKFVGAFHLSRRVSDENRACSISILFFKVTELFDGRSFLMCSHDPFFGTNKNRNLKNGSCEQAFTELKFTGQLQMASLSLCLQPETNLISNRKVIELLLQLKSTKAHGKNNIKVRPSLVRYF